MHVTCIQVSIECSSYYTKDTGALRNSLITYITLFKFVTDHVGGITHHSRCRLLPKLVLIWVLHNVERFCGYNRIMDFLFFILFGVVFV